MAKDYAKYHFKKHSIIEKGLFKRLALVLLIITMMGCGLGGFYLYKTEQVVLQQFFIKAKSFLDTAPQPTEQTGHLPPVAKKTPDIHFDFYTELPKAQLKPLGAATINNASGYVLRLGLFEKEANANARRISLLLLGFEADIVKAERGYALQLAGFARLADAKAMQTKLKKKGIESVIKKG